MSVTGQTGHIAVAKQTAFGTPNTTAAQYRGVKITGDSLVSANNPLTANNEIGVGRDITASIPGGFSAAGSLSGNLRARSAAVFLEGAVGPHADVSKVTGPPAYSDYTDYELIDLIPYFTMEKKVGSTTHSANELLTVRYTDAVINTLNLTAPSAAFATFSAGVIACSETYIGSPLVAVESTAYDKVTFPAGYDPLSDQLLAFHGGRILLGDSADGAGWTDAPPVYGTSGAIGSATVVQDDTFQSFEVAVNNNVQSDEYTVRPSRFLRSVTEGIRSIDINITQVFTDYHEYQRFNYGATGRTTPGYALYMGAVDFFLGNWQLAVGEQLVLDPPTGAPANPQGIECFLPKVAFSGFPVTLTTGRIVVTTSAVALKPGTGQALSVFVRPQGAGFNY